MNNKIKEKSFEELVEERAVITETINDCLYEYDYNGNLNLIHFKNSDGFEYWKEYDENNNLIHYKNSKGDEYWKDSNGDFITKEEYDKIKKSPDIINFHYDEPLGFRSEKKEYTDEKVSLFTRIKNIFSRT